MGRFFKGCLMAIGGLVVLVIVIAVIGAVAGHSSSSSGPTATAKPDTSNGGVPAPTKATNHAAAAGVTLLSISGTGTHTTQDFTASDNWDLHWSYDCSSYGSQGNMIVSVYNADATFNIDDAGIDQLGKSGSGVEHFHSGGKLYLSVNSECAWTLRAVTA